MTKRLGFAVDLIAVDTSGEKITPWEYDECVIVIDRFSDLVSNGTGECMVQ